MIQIIQCGAGGYGRFWLDTMLETTDTVEYAALVDPDAAALATAAKRTGVPEDRCFATIEEAIAAVQADAVLCVVPPKFHEPVITAALTAGLHVLTEKPLSDSMESSIRLVELAESTGRTLMVAQKGRFNPWVARFREAVVSEEAGRISHVSWSFRAPEFFWGLGSDFRHHMPDPFLTEMSIHHFDMMRALTGRDPVEVSGSSWNFPGSGFDGDIAAQLRFTMDDGLPIIYDGFIRSSGDLTSWFGDIRAECDTGVIAMVSPQLYIAHRGAHQGLTAQDVTAPKTQLAEVGLSNDGQIFVLREFVDALAHHSVPESCGRENLKSLAMLFAAIDACHTHETRRISDYLQSTSR